MKKRFLGVLLCVAMSAAMVMGCSSDTGSDSSSDSSAEETAEESTGGKIYMTVSNQQNEFMVGMKENFLEIGESLGYDVTFMDANLDATQQIAQIETAIADDADAIFLEPCSADGLTTGLQEASEAGIPVFVIHNSVSDTDLITSLIHVDVKEGGALKMQQCMEDLGGKGDIALVTGTLGQDTTNQICGGYEEVLADYPDINIVFEGEGNWGATDAATLAENWLSSGKNIDAIVCNNDGMALGVLPVLESAGKTGDILVYGLDATSEGLKAVKAGTMAATIYVDSHAELEEAFRMTKEVMNGNEVDTEFVVPAVLVTQENVDDYIE